MSESLSTFHNFLIQLSEPILEHLSKTQYSPSESSNISVKSLIESLLSQKSNPNFDDDQIRTSVRDFSLACALLSSAQSSTHELLSWIPQNLSAMADTAICELSMTHSSSQKTSKRIHELGIDCSLVPEEKRLVVELMPEVLPLLKDKIKESCIDKSDDIEEFSAASARAPVGFAIVAAYQFRWFITQIDYPHLGMLCALVIPCALTALDHWSSEVKGQGMVSFIHIGRNVNAAELGWYEDVILDACCQNIPSSDEVWHLVVEMSVILVTCIQRCNPRSMWFERILNEMLSHLERQPRNKERRVAWLQHIEPLFKGLGLVLLANFRRIFPLFFKWMRADDDETVLLVLRQVHIVIKLTWIRNTPFVERLVDELVILLKKPALERSNEDIQLLVSKILALLHQCKGKQFEVAYNKYKDDPNLENIVPPFGVKNSSTVVQ